MLILLAAQGAIRAQDSPPFSHRPVQVWLQHDVDAAGRDRLRFVDRRSGAETDVDLPGERYTALGSHVLYFDVDERRVRLVNAAGEVSDHPFIQLPGATRRVDWAVSMDGSRIAWTFTEQAADGRLRSFTSVANSDGSEERDVLVDGPRSGSHAVPVAFSQDGATLYMDYRPLMAEGATRRHGYAELFALNLAEGFTRPLPGEPGCLCGAAFVEDRTLRLQLAEDPGGHELVLRDANGVLLQRIAAPTLPGFTEATHLLAAPDGAQALYTLSQVRGGGNGERAVRSVFVLVDLPGSSNRILGAPVSGALRPVTWSDGDDSVLVTSADPQRDGSWKLQLADGALLPVTRASWLGALAG